jgi:hypothetical protein
MRKFFLIAAALAGLSSPALARRVVIVDAARAGRDQGSLVAVRGRAEIHDDTVHQGTDVNLVNESGRVIFTGFIPRLNEYAFPQLAGLDGQTVVMYGIIELYRGRPATQLTYTDQLRGG